VTTSEYPLLYVFASSCPSYLSRQSHSYPCRAFSFFLKGWAFCAVSSGIPCLFLSSRVKIAATRREVEKVDLVAAAPFMHVR
jgi:hypothetical protein